MPRNGTGTMVRTDGVRTGATVFQQEAAAGIDIEANLLDTEAQDMADALTASIANDGQTPILADLPMTGFKHTNVAAATAATDYLRADQGQGQAGPSWDGTFGGTANALTATLSPVPASYAAGLIIRGIVAATNTASATMNANALGLITIKKKLAAGNVALTGGEMIIGTVVEMVSDGTDLILADKTEEQQGATIASAATVDLATSTGEYLLISGSTGPITSFGTLPAGVERTLVFSGTPTITYNAVSMILPGAVDYTPAAGDSVVMRSLGSGNWRMTDVQPAAGILLAQGRQVLSISGGALVANTTNGAVASSAETATNDVMLTGYSFSNTGTAYAQFSWPTPPSWNAGTVTFRPRWYAASSSGDVRWYLRAVAISNGDALDAAFGTAQTSTDTLTGTNQLCIGPESSAITIAGTPAKSDQVVFQVYRVGGGTGDTLAAAAVLLGLDVFIALNAPNEA